MKIKIRYLGVVFLILILVSLIISQDSEEDKKEDFVTTEDGEVVINGKKFYLLKNTEVNYVEDNAVIKPLKGGIIKIDGKEFNIKIDKDNPSKLIVDKNGELIEGTKFTAEEGEFTLRGYKLNIPKDSKVEYFKDRIVITAPSGSELTPEIEDVEKVEGKLEVTTKEPGFLKTSKGDLQLLEDVNDLKTVKKTSLFYEQKDGKLYTYIKDEFGVFLNDKGEAEFTFINTRFSEENPNLYLVNDEKDLVVGASILLKENRIGSVSYTGDGPIIKILAGNRLGSGVNVDGSNDLTSGEKTLSFQGKNGFAIMNRVVKGKIPSLQFSGDSVYGPDEKTFLTKNPKDRLEIRYIPKSIIKGVDHGKGTVALRIFPYDDNGKRIKLFDLFVNDENEYITYPPGVLGDPTAIVYDSKKDQYFSSGVFFDQLSSESKKEYGQLIKGDREKLYEAYNKGGSAALEKGLQEFYGPSKNPVLKAIVKIHSSVKKDVGSGTIVGVKDGKYYVLSAAHVVEGEKDILIDLSSTDDNYKPSKEKDSSSIKAKIVANSERGYDTPDQKDLVLLELQPTNSQLEEIKGRGFIKIASKESDVKVGDKGFYVGCPVGTYISRGCTVTEIDKITGTDSLRTKSNPIAGQSGGPYIINGKLVGVTHSGSFGYGGFASIPSMLKFFEDNPKYKFLVKFILIFIPKGGLENVR